MIHQKSTDTKIIENVFAECKVGDVVTYDDLSKAIGRDVRKFASGAIQTAKKTMLKDHSMVFGTVRNVGFQRLQDEQIVDTFDNDRLRMQRIAKTSLGKLSTVKFDALNEDQKKRHVAASAQAGALAMFSQKSTSKKIESSVQSTSTMAIGDTLKLFS